MTLNKNQEIYLNALKGAKWGTASANIAHVSAYCSNIENWETKEGKAFLALSPKEELEVLMAYAEWGLKEEANRA